VKFVSEHNIAMSIIYLEEAEALRLTRSLNLDAAPPNSPDAPNAAAANSATTGSEATDSATTKATAAKAASQNATNPADRVPPGGAGGETDESGDTVSPRSMEEVGDNLPPPTFYGRIFPARIWLPVKAKVTTLSAQEAFTIWIKAALISGIIIASPYMFYQIWTFVAAGLYPHEQRHVRLYLPFSLGLFLLGASTAFFLVFDPVLDFLFKFNLSMNIDPDPRISEWIGFVLVLPLGFGIAFQLPLVMLFLNRVGIMSVRSYIDKWRIAVLVIFVLSAVLTPADPISMLAMALPLTFLYYLGIALCQWMPPLRNPIAEAE